MVFILQGNKLLIEDLELVYRSIYTFDVVYLAQNCTNQMVRSIHTILGWLLCFFLSP